MKKNIFTFLFSLMMIICQVQYAFAGESLPSGVQESQVEEKADAIMKKHIGKDVCGACLVVINHGKVVFEKGYGYSDAENKIPVDPHKTVFEYGSISKLFVWSSAMKLVEEGKLDLDKDIREYLPKDFKMNTSYDKPITMKMLMNHMGGFSDYCLGLMCHEEEVTDLRTVLESAGEKQSYEPGTIFSYSNYGTALAGYVVECIENKPFYKYVNDEIFNPLDMKNASSNPLLKDNEGIKKNKAKAYYYESDGNFQEGTYSIINMYPAGSINGTIDDLSKFALQFMKDKQSKLFKDNNTISKMLEPTYSRAEGMPNVCHGFMYYDGEKQGYWHDGETECFQGYFMIVPEERSAVILLYNNSGDDCSIQDEVAELLNGKTNKTLDKPYSGSENAYEVEGDYIIPRRSYSGITQLITFPGGANATVTALSNNEISVDGEKYTQVGPYIYENNKDKSKIVFKMENGKVVKASGILDIIPITATERIRPTFTIIFGGFNLIMAVVILLKGLISALMRAGKKESLGEEEKRLGKNIAVLYGFNMIFIGNIVLAILRFLSDMKIQFAALRIHFILEIVFALVMLYLIFKNSKLIINSKAGKFTKILDVLFIVSCIMIIIVFAWWGAFNFIS